MIDKRRSGPNEVGEMKVVGDVQGKLCVIIDDMVDTGGTLCKAAEAVLEKGATKVLALATHGVLSSGAKERLANSSIEKIILTDTIYHTDLQEYGDKFVVLSIASLIGEAIRRINQEDSVNSLFEDDFNKKT